MGQITEFPIETVDSSLTGADVEALLGFANELRGKKTASEVEASADYTEALTNSAAVANAAINYVNATKNADAVEYGLTGDDAIADLQAFTDYCESNNLVADFSRLNSLAVKGTWYWGNTALRFGQCRINITSTSSFSQLGTASRANEGAILTKSSGAAGYGLSTVKIVFDQLLIDFSRPDGTSTIRTPILLEKTSLVAGRFIEVITPDGETFGKTPIDFYRAVQNVFLIGVNIYNRCGTNAGGFWIRNSTGAEKTKNINIGMVTIDQQSGDEALAIYNFASASADIENVNIGSVHAIVSGDGTGVAVMNKFTYSGDMYKNINIGSVYVSMTSTNDGPFGFKTEKCKPNIGSVRVDVGDVSGATGDIYAVRDVSTPGDYLNKIDSVAVTLDTVNPAIHSIFGVNGSNLVIGNLKTSSTNGSYQNIITNVEGVDSGIIGGNYDGFAARNVRYINADVYGRMEGVHRFNGLHVIDTDDFNNTAWFVHSAATSAPDISVEYSGRQRIIGAGTVSNPISLNATLTEDIAVIINYSRENHGSLTVGNDYNGGSFKLTQYDVTSVDGTAIVRKAKALSV